MRLQGTPCSRTLAAAWSSSSSIRSSDTPSALQSTAQRSSESERAREKETGDESISPQRRIIHKHPHKHPHKHTQAGTKRERRRETERESAGDATLRPILCLSQLFFSISFSGLWGRARGREEWQFRRQQPMARFSSCARDRKYDGTVPAYSRVLECAGVCAGGGRC